MPPARARNRPDVSTSDAARLRPLLWNKRARTRDDLLVAAQTLLLKHSAGSLAVTDIAACAGVSHGTFYNYFDTIDALIDVLGALVVAAHAKGLATATTFARGPVEIFTAKTRQTLQFAAERGDYGRILFDAGLPIDRLAGALREDLLGDLRAGLTEGAFQTESAEVAASLVSGCVLGAALDLHRGRLAASAIDDAATQVLRLLGVSPETARRAAASELPFTAAPTLPLTWRALAQDGAAP
jgi:AcrR family transcriptional regulator